MQNNTLQGVEEEESAKGKRRSIEVVL